MSKHMRFLLSRLRAYARRKHSNGPYRSLRDLGSFTKMSSSATSAVLYAATISASASVFAKPAEASDKKHHVGNGAGFKNPWDSFKDLSVPSILGGMIWRRLSGRSNVPDTAPPTVPVRKPDFLPTRHTAELRATWLGHAAYLVEFPSGLRVLFDPVFSDRCSPFSFMGPKRYTEPPCQIDDIPYIDAVVISHNHYDHMDHPTIKKILARHPNVHFFVPLGNKQWFTASKISPSQVTELDWWETRDLQLSRSTDAAATNGTNGDADKPAAAAVVVPSSESSPSGNDPSTISATLGCLPCQHISARTPFDKCRTLWASWSVESGGKRVYFGGDTGYRSVPELPATEDDYGPGHDYPRCPAFAEIGQLRGPFDLALIPIGAYDPRYIMSPVHANPFDSVNIFKDIKAKRAMGIHWGTWVLTEEDVLEPPRKLKEALQRSGIEEAGVFDVCDIGESRTF